MRPATVPRVHVCLSILPAVTLLHFCQECGAHLKRPSFPAKPEAGGEELDRRPTNDTAQAVFVGALRSPALSGRDFLGAHAPQALAQMIKRQSKNRYFNTAPHHLPFRAKVLAWMESLVCKFGYQQSTLHLAVGYFDAVLSLYTVTTAQLKLISYICLFLAAKMEEKDEKIPLVEEAFKLFDKEFSAAEILNCEKLVFKILDYQLNLKTPYAFCTFFLSRGALFEDELPSLTTQEERRAFVARFEALVLSLATCALRDYSFYQFTSIAVAVACVALARKAMGLAAPWSRELEELTLLNW